jgi:hypothetical protein
MSETHLISPPSIVESPVADPTLFLMYERNRAYLQGKTALPHLSNQEEESYLAGVLLFGGVAVMFLVFGGGTFLMRWFRDLENSSLVVMGFFLAILLAMGVMVVMRDMQLAKSASAEKEGTPVPPKPQLLEGTVTHAEKIRDQHGVARLGVRYQFAAPGGIIMTGYAEGLCEDASHPMGPVPGTPVKIYYEQEQKYYLL